MALSCQLGITLCVPQEKEAFFIPYDIYKFARSKWLDNGLVLLLWTSTLSRSTQKNELGQCPAKLTSRLVNNQYILIEQALTIIHIYLDRVTQPEPIDGWEVRISHSSTLGEWVTLAQWGFSIQFGF